MFITLLFSSAPGATRAGRLRTGNEENRLLTCLLGTSSYKSKVLQLTIKINVSDGRTVDRSAGPQLAKCGCNSAVILDN